ncbi:hypothetical protein ACFQY8_05720 [Alloscardovia venturai]|uniref:DUF4190 domain-containing protein n=1 Tax=Alloscardovia venturai TaxID=1769421 RepID=A0ABW2Y6M3_9BIFI
MTDEIVSENVSSAADTPREHKQTERLYGRMASEFPGWDPYVYGKPEKREKPQERKNPKRIQVIAMPPMSGGGTGAGKNPQGTQSEDQPKNGGEREQNSPFVDENGNPVNLPFHFEPFDPDDPQKNPLYGKWDFYAFVAFILAFTPYTAVLALFIGWLSVVRTTKFHMKGRWLAILAVIFSLAVIALVVYLMATGTTAEQFAQELETWAANIR